MFWPEIKKRKKYLLHFVPFSCPFPGAHMLPQHQQRLVCDETPPPPQEQTACLAQTMT